MNTIVIEGNLEVKLQIYGRMHNFSVVRRVSEEKESEKRESGQRRSKCAKGRKVAQHCIFTMVCGSGGRKVGLEMEIGRNIEK
jgi:hypothetical protein